MKWIKGLFQKDATQRLTFSDLPIWLEERWHLHFDELEKEIGKLYGEINRAMTDLESDLVNLESAIPDESAPLKLQKAGCANREAVTRQIWMLLERIGPPKETEISSAIEYHTALIRHLERTMNKLERPRRYVRALFPEESERLITSLGELGRLLHQIGEAIDEKSDDLRAFNSARELHREIQELEGGMNEMRELIESDEERLDLSRKAASKLEDEISGRESGSDVQSLGALKEALDEKRREAIRIEAEMADQIAPLAKALSRLAKQNSSERLTLSPDCRRILDLFLRSPFEVQDHEIPLLMAELLRHVEKDHLGIKGKKKEKIITHINHLMDADSLKTIRARQTNVRASLMEMEQSFSAKISDASRMDDLLRQSKEETSMLEERIRQNRDDLAKLEEETTKKRSQLSLWLEEISGSKVEISL